MVVAVLLGLSLLLAPIYAALPGDSLWASWLSAGMFAAALIALLAAGRGDRTFLSPFSRAEQAFLVLLGLAFLSIPLRLIAQHSTAYFGPMLRGWADLATGFAAFALARRVASDRASLYGLVFAAIVASVIVADIGVQEYVSHVRAGDPHARTFATSTPDYLAGYFVLLLPVTLAAFLQAPAVRGLTPLLRALAPLVLGIILLFQLASLLTTGSRFALLSLAVALAVFAAALVRALRHGLALDRATRLLGIVLGVGLLFGVLVFARPVLGRLGNLNDNSAAFRVWTWKGAVQMAAANPVLGTGIGTWEDLYPRYALTGFTRAAHNSYLQLAAECGVPALLALLAALGWLGSSLVRGLTAAPVERAAAPVKADYLPTDHRLLLCGLLAALAGGVVKNLADSDWYVFFFGFTFWTLAGLAASLVAPATAVEEKPVRPLLFAAGSVAATFAALTAAQGVGAMYAARAQEQTATDPQSAARAYDAARAWDPLNARYASDQGYKVFYRRLGNLTEAEAAARTAVALGPNPVNCRRLGDILQQFGRQPEARAAYEDGLRADPHSLDLLLRLARLSPPPRALDYYRRMSELELTPVGTVRALGEYTETNFAVADAVLGDEAAKTSPAQAAAYYARAARVLEQYADGGGSLNPQQEALNEGNPNPRQDASLGGLYGHVLTAWIALAPPNGRDALRQRQEKYRQIYDALIAQSSKSGTLESRFLRRQLFVMNITAIKRGSQTKGERKKRIRQGFIPGAIYGKGLEPVNVEVPAKAIADVLTAETGLNTIIDLTIQGDAKPHTVLVDNLERNPITRSFVSVGFHQVKKGDKVTAQIPIQLIGEPASVGTGEAVLEHTLEAITVHAEPANLPPHLDVDVSHLTPGDVLHVSDLPHNPNLEFTTSEETAVAAVHYSRTAQAVEEADVAAAEVAAEAEPTGADAVTELRADADANSDSVTGV